MNLLITGSNGFIGKNLKIFLEKNSDYNLLFFNRYDSKKTLKKHIDISDFIIHLAGENRPKKNASFLKVNFGLTLYICSYLKKINKKIPIIYSSSQKVFDNSYYGISKLKAENILVDLSKTNKNPIFIYRLPGIFGKWARPNYNNFIATFCFNLHNNHLSNIINGSKKLPLIYIDDLVKSFYNVTRLKKVKLLNYIDIKPTYNYSPNFVYKHLLSFANYSNTLQLSNVGIGFLKKLYSTYLSYSVKNTMISDLIKKSDKRGDFVEFLKTIGVGQMSIFTINPNQTRGDHFHNTKNEKFIVIHGEVLFSTICIITNKRYKFKLCGEDMKVIKSIPGYNHELKNIGKDVAKVVLWTNEIYNPKYPDTYSRK